MSQIRFNSYSLLPPVVKNLLIINGIMFLATWIFKTRDPNFVQLFGLHFFTAENFRIWQLVTYMFMHGSFTHLFFNMFALWMFGAALENSWGQKRLLLYYFVCGIGAGLIQELTLAYELRDVLQSGAQIINTGTEIVPHLMPKADYLNLFVTVGASGSVFGLLLAFGMMFPNSMIYVFMLIPLRAKWFVLIYGALELYYGVSGTQDGIAHFAHLGGMLFGFFLILYWNKGNRFFSFKIPSLFKKKRNYKYTISSNYQYEPHSMSDEDYNFQKKQNEEKINRILDKISKNGYESLTQEEKEFLFRQKR
jgi:membrane associated rhomboid family serine protease